MDYIEIDIRISGVSESTLELLPYLLEKLGFEGFVNIPDRLLAYIPSEAYKQEGLACILNEYKFPDNCFSTQVIPEKNWNEEWEHNFQPVVIAEKCRIRAPFHPPDHRYPYEIIIEPKMSFGTGHHATTSLMVSELLTLAVNGRTVLDAGCGTGILSILAEKLGASIITAVDIDDWSYRNSIENAEINHCKRIEVILGDAAGISGSTYKIILANINLNILKSSLKNYFQLLESNGVLVMSGILASDIESLKHESEKQGLVFEHSKTLNNWALVRFKKM